MTDALQNFHFEHGAVRGAIVRIEDAWRTLRALRSYPEPVAELLGGALVSVALLSSTLKLGGSMTLQIQGSGPVRLLVAEFRPDGRLRGTARWNGAALPCLPATLPALTGEAHCAVVLKDESGVQTYQGTVDVRGDTLAGALESYMARSEQIETRLWLFAGPRHAGGLLLQRMPGREEADPDLWERACALAATVRAEEIAELAASLVLRRLFFEEDLRIHEPRPLVFSCSCSRERVAAALRVLGRDDVADLLAREGRVETTCEFCGRVYTMQPAECLALFDPSSDAP